MRAYFLALLLIPVAVSSCSDNRQKTQACPKACVKCNADLSCGDCQPGVNSCRADEVVQCNADGTIGPAIKTCDSGAGEHCAAGNCLTACDVAASTHSYIGCDYWPTTLLNSELNPLFDFAVVVANPEQVGDVTTGGPARVKIVQGSAPCDPNGDLSDGVAFATVSAGQVKTILLPWNFDLSQNLMGETSVDVSDGAYHLCSSLPVTVYQFNPLQFQKSGAKCPNDPNAMNGQCHSYTNDASILLPTTALEKDYIVAAYQTFGLQQMPNFTNPKPQPGATPGYFAVVATQPHTTVNVTFSAYTAGGINVEAHKPGDRATFMLEVGEVLEIISDKPSWSAKMTKPACVRTDSDFQGTYCDMGKDYDLTGTQISADKPIAAFGGHSCAFVPYNKWACDHLEEQLFPLATWGKETVAVQTPASVKGEYNLFRVIAGTPGTTITFDPPVSKPVTLDTAQWVEVEAEGGLHVTATAAAGQPRMQVVQFMVGQDAVTSQFMGVGDPAMGLTPPVEQWRKSYDFLNPETFNESYVTVVGKVGSSFTLDKKDEMIGFNQMIGNSGYGYEYVMVPPGAHHITSDSPFSINVSGVAPFTAYLFCGGLNLIELNPQ